MPTLLELLGVDSYRRSDGSSLVGLMDGHDDAPNHEAYAENTYPGSRFGWGELRALRRGRFKLIATTRPELYDLERDPQEQQNLFGERPQLARAMLARLTAVRRNASAHRPPLSESHERERREQLASLGYVGSSPPTVGEGPPRDAPDPKDKVDEYNRRTSRR